MKYKKGISHDTLVLLKASRAELKEELVYYSGIITIIVPEGFITDFASVPRIFRPFLPVLGKHNNAAILHDYLYSEHWAKESKNMTVHFTRKQCDRIFLHAMEILGVSLVNRMALYAGVRLGGKKYFKRGSR